jgi:hypothetical protein
LIVCGSEIREAFTLQCFCSEIILSFSYGELDHRSQHRVTAILARLSHAAQSLHGNAKEVIVRSAHQFQSKHDSEPAAAYLNDLLTALDSPPLQPGGAQIRRAGAV